MPLYFFGVISKDPNYVHICYICGCLHSIYINDVKNNSEKFNEINH